MEKSTHSPGGALTRSTPHRIRRHAHVIPLLIVVGLLAWIHLGPPLSTQFRYQQPLPHESPNAHLLDDGDLFGFNWSSIEPTPVLQYHKCYSELQCARLRVPLDWFNGTAPGENVDIAVVKVPAKVPQSDPRYGGPIFINPGGPGGSGTLFAAMGGRALQILTDTASNSSGLGGGSPNETYHDIIGFDPRGIGATTPPAYCFDDEDSRLMWMIKVAEEGLPGSSNAALGRLLSLNRALGASCNSRIEKGGSILNYMSTAVVAKDMLELARQDAEWRRRNATGTSPASSIWSGTGDVKVKFWGFSYGTLLGATFASMFPDNVGPMVLDGVLEPSDFINHHWSGSVEDTDKALQSFYDHCAAAGPVGWDSPGQGCELASNGSTPADVRERVQGILTQLYHNPLWLNAPYGPDVVSYSMVKSYIFGALYSPILAFPGLAMILDRFERGDKEFAASFAAQFRLLPSSSVSSTAAPPRLLPNDAGMAVECTDSDSFAALDTDAWQFVARELNAVSGAGGSLLASLHLRCAGWNNTHDSNDSSSSIINNDNKIMAPFRFAGPFGGKTATPVLWIGNTADPICPLKGAVNQARRFEGSVVLRHDTTGHCSLAASSRCTTDAVRAYFARAQLPPEGTVCRVSQVPWGARLPGQEVEVLQEGDAEQRALVEANLGLNELHHGLGMGYGMPMAGVGRMQLALRDLWARD